MPPTVLKKGQKMKYIKIFQFYRIDVDLQVLVIICRRRGSIYPFWSYLPPYVVFLVLNHTQILPYILVFSQVTHYFFFAFIF